MLRDSVYVCGGGVRVCVWMVASWAEYFSALCTRLAPTFGAAFTHAHSPHKRVLNASKDWLLTGHGRAPAR